MDECDEIGLDFEILGIDDRDDYGGDDDVCYDDDVDDEYMCSDTESSSRDFAKYSEKQMEDIVNMFFNTGCKFETINHKYKKLKDRREIYR